MNPVGHTTMQFRNIVISGYMNAEDLKKLAEVVTNILQEQRTLKDENKKPRPPEKNNKKTDHVESEKNIVNN